MQIVIDIDVQAYNKCLKLVDDNDGGILGIHLINAVANGTPLPKGHGRLIDADAVYDDFEKGEYDFEESLEFAPTIIPTDKESEDNE